MFCGYSVAGNTSDFQSEIVGSIPIIRSFTGEVSERSMVPVLKTGSQKWLVGSNPTFSAIK